MLTLHSTRHLGGRSNAADFTGAATESAPPLTIESLGFRALGIATCKMTLRFPNITLGRVKDTFSKL